MNVMHFLVVLVFLFSSSFRVSNYLVLVCCSMSRNCSLFPLLYNLLSISLYVVSVEFVLRKRLASPFAMTFLVAGGW